MSDGRQNTCEIKCQHICQGKDHTKLVATADAGEQATALFVGAQDGTPFARS